ncbi:tyrosine-type recombinase/integrase [Enterococcus sp. DIV0187]|uniref:tyrosine-type recombinase/integrase n=1 Tax=Enterococcus sp. DIV0187 TaxID=2774644 RepID=UPI003F201B90
MKEKVKLKELIKLLDQELQRVGYKEATLNYYRSNWKRLTDYFDSQNEFYFSESVAMRYVDEKCDFFAKEQAGTLTQSNVYLFRIVRMLGDFQQHGIVLRRYNQTLNKVNQAKHLKLLERFERECYLAEYAKSTQESYSRTAENFLYFIEGNGIILEQITASNLNDFVKTLLGYRPKMVEFVLCGTRSFLRFLYKENVLKTDCTVLIPTIHVPNQTIIPSVWDKDDLYKLVNAIDRENPSGKRDYAIILLVARLGLRCIDIKHLTFSSLNWDENYLEFAQSKTNNTVRLPLLKDVGWAIIDYIKNGRPISDSPYIFLRHLAPIGAFSDNDHLHQMIVKHMRVAKIPVTKEKKIGMHSLRHTLATTLLENHTPIQEISDILGHQSTESTPIYLKSSLRLLSECALSPEVE